ncbi:hypothetical protein BsWGS_16909 [Bradybaena similaris]
MVAKFFIFTAQTVAFDGLVSVSGDTTLGEAAYISCTYVTLPNEEVSKFSIWRLPFSTTNTDSYYFVISKSGDATEGSARHSRLSVSVNKTGNPGVSSASMTAAMKIANIQCSDEAKYGCYFLYKMLGGAIRGYKTSMRLVLKARPKPPTITFETANLHPVAEQFWAYEMSLVTVKCSANIGRPGLGIVEWRLYHGWNQKPENIALEDQRVHALTKAPLVGEPSCTQRVEQRFILKVQRDSDDLVIACFVHNAQFPRTKPSVYCVNSSEDMCNRSTSLCVIRVPNSEDEQRTMLTFICAVFAGLLTTLIVLLWRSFFYKKPEKPQVVREPKPNPTKPKPIHQPRENDQGEYLETESVLEETETVSSTGETEV